MKNHNKLTRPGGAGESRGAGYSRPPLARMLRLHERLTASRYPNCRQMAEEFEVSAKTVQRDVNFMRDQLALPIEYDKKRFGFHYTRSVSGFPAAGIADDKTGANPWNRSAPPAIGEQPALSAAGPRGLPVRIRFAAASARSVRRRTWHATQVIHALPGGGVDITLQARDEREIARWILSWGAQAWVIEPPRLRNLVREIAREILARH